MKVVILCGGQGTRLREETEFRPKPMVKIGQFPVLWHIMKHFSFYGHNDFILCLGYKGELIKQYFYHYELMRSDVTIELGKKDKINYHPRHDEAGWKVTLVDTGENALKGARLKKIQKYIDSDDFFVTYGDGVSDVNLDKLEAFHRKHGKVATLTGVNPGSRFGELKINNNSITEFSEKADIKTRFINGGFFVLNKKIFKYLTTNDNCDLEFGPMEKLAQKKQLMVYKHRGYWACMDTYRDMKNLNKQWRSGKPGWKVW